MKHIFNLALVRGKCTFCFYKMTTTIIMRKFEKYNKKVLKNVVIQGIRNILKTKIINKNQFNLIADLVKHVFS